MNNFEDTINKIFDKINLNEEKKVLKVTKKQILDAYNDIKEINDNSNNKLTKIKNNNKKKSNDDFSKIKKPKNPYMIYYTENYKSIKEKNDGISFGEISKLLSEKWKNMGENEKKQFIEKSEKDKQRYKIEIKELEDNRIMV